MKKIIALLCVVVLAATAVVGVTSVRSSNKIKDLNSEIASLQQAVDSGSKTIEGLNGDVTAKTAEIEGLTAQIEALKADADAKAAEIETLTADVTAKTAEIKGLTAENATAQETAAALDAQRAALEEQLSQLTAEAEAKNAEIERLNGELTAAQVTLKTIADTLNPAPKASAERALPAVGQVINGFEVKDVRSFALLNADVVVYEHQQTGALVMLLANDDNNRAFEITFRTPAETDMGVSHVFEHSTLDGSEKYPSKTLFFNLSYQTYNTYMNAFTMNMLTSYPVASLSEAQLLKYADFYTDSVFHPMLLKDKTIIDEEAWRYSLADADADLTIAGTVYSEMLGSYTINSAANFNAMQTLFPGSTVGNSHGGNPEHIPDMTYDDLITYHQKYYHPSNSLTCLYGNFEDPAAFLELLNGYFSAYEKKEFVIEDAGYTPITEAQNATFTYAVEAGSNTDHGAVIYYGFVCGEKDEETLNKLDLLTTLLGSDGSVLMQNMKTALPTASVSCYVDIASPELAVIFSATGVNAEDAETFKSTVNSSLAQIAEEGFNPDDVDAIIAAFRLDLLLTGEGTSIGTDMIPNIVYYWASMGNMYGFMNYVDALDLFKQYAEDGTFQANIKDYLLNNARTALAVTAPEAGLKEQQDAALAEKLAGIKAAMSEEEIAAIVAETAALANPSEEDASQYVAQLQAVTVDTLPEEARIYEISDTVNAQGNRVVNALANADGVGQTLLLLDAAGLTQDQLFSFKLYTQLLGDLDTEAHTRGELASLITRYLYGANIRVSVFDHAEDDGYSPYLRVSFTAMDEDMDAAYALVRELLFGSNVEDVQRLKDTVSALKTSLKNSITSAPYNVPLYRALATQSGSTAYYVYITYLDYYEFLEKTEALLESEPETVVANLKAIQEYFNNSNGAVIGFSGSAESAANHQRAAEAFLAELENREIEKQTYEFPQAGAREAMIVDSAVNYNLVFAGYKDLGMEEYSGALDAVTSLVADSFLYPLLRDQYGAYSVMHGATDTGVYILTYRDPNVKESFDVFAQLPDLVATLGNLDQETLDGYINSAYSYYAQGTGEITGGMSAVLNTISGDKQEIVLDYMKQLKSITADSVAQYADMYKALAEKGMIATVGAASVINANADRYDTVLDPFGVSSQPEQQTPDIVEGEWYYDAVMFAYQNGLMAPADIEHFGVNDDATVGDLAVMMYQLVGGSNVAEEAIADLAAEGIFSAEAKPGDVLTREALTQAGNAFVQAMQLGAVDYELPETEAENATRAEAAQVILKIYMKAVGQ